MSDALSREIDALVAEHVMGATWATPYFIRDDVEVLAFEHPETQRHTATFVLATRGEKTLFDPWDLLPHYSTDISAAWKVVEKMDALGSTLELYSPGALINDEFGAFAEAWTARFASWTALHTQGQEPSGPHGPESEADTAPEAICLAALRAKGVDV